MRMFCWYSIDRALSILSLRLEIKYTCWEYFAQEGSTPHRHVPFFMYCCIHTSSYSFKQQRSHDGLLADF